MSDESVNPQSVADGRPSEPSGGPPRWLVAVLAVGLVASGVVAVISFTGSSSDTDAVLIDPDDYDVVAGIELGDLEAGCINLGAGPADGEVCLARVEAGVEISVAGFEPGSELAVTGPGVDERSRSIDADGGHRSELTGLVPNQPVAVTGTLADGRSAGVTVGLLD